MATNVTLNAVSYSIPANGNSGWGLSLSNYLIALSTGVLSKAGGTFTLTGEIDFGATFGVKAPYFKSKGTNIANAGVLRLANAQDVSWRNAANSADLALTVNASNQLAFDGNILAYSASVQPLDADLTAIAALSSTGILVRTASDTWATRSISSSTSSLSVSNGDGVSGNVSLAIVPSNIQITDLAGTLSVTKGGTGQTSANAALNALLPSQGGNSGKVLTTNGTDTSWSSGLTSTLASANIFIGNGSNVATAVGVTGDVTIDNAGVTAIGALKVTNAMLAGSIAYSKLSLTGAILDADLAGSISGSKVTPSFGSQNVSTTGTLAAGNTTITGTVSVSSTLTASGRLNVANRTVLTPTAVTAGTYSGLDVSGGTYFTFGGGSATTINGLAGGVDGQIIHFLELAGQNVTLVHNGVGTQPINTGTGANVVLNVGGATLVYNGSAGKWFPLGFNV